MKTNKRKRNLSLKRLREIIGSSGKPMTQSQFAAMVGVSLPLIKAVESGQYPVKPKLAAKIMQATGARLLWWDFKTRTPDGKVPLVPAANGKIYWLPKEEMLDALPGRKLGREYTREHFEFHRQFFETNEEAGKVALKEASAGLEALFTAAAKPGVAGIKFRLPALRHSFWEWVRESNQKFKLGVRPEDVARRIS